MLCILFAITCAIMIAIYFTTAGMLVSYLERHPNSGNLSMDSIPDGLYSLSTHITHFLDDGITTGQVLTNTTIGQFVRGTEVHWLYFVK